MSRFLVAVAAIALFGTLAPASAGVVITVDKTAQHLSVSVDGRSRYEWPVSTARIGYRTPNGSYRPERLERQWFSRKIRLVADAAFDFLQRRLCDPRQL